MQEHVGIQEDVEKEELHGEIGDGQQLVHDVHTGVMRVARQSQITSHEFGNEAAKRVHRIFSVTRPS